MLQWEGTLRLPLPFLRKPCNHINSHLFGPKPLARAVDVNANLVCPIGEACPLLLRLKQHADVEIAEHVDAYLRQASRGYNPHCPIRAELSASEPCSGVLECLSLVLHLGPLLRRAERTFTGMKDLDEGSATIASAERLEVAPGPVGLATSMQPLPRVVKG